MLVGGWVEFKRTGRSMGYIGRRSKVELGRAWRNWEEFKGSKEELGGA